MGVNSASHALLQRAIDGRQSTIQQLLERTNFNFSFKSDLSSSEQSVMLAFLSPIVCNTSYMDIKRLYATFGMFLASLKSDIKTSCLSSGPPSPAVHVRVPSKLKLNQRLHTWQPPRGPGSQLLRLHQQHSIAASSSLATDPSVSLKNSHSRSHPLPPLPSMIHPDSDCPTRPPLPRRP